MYICIYTQTVNAHQTHAESNKNAIMSLRFPQSPLPLPGGLRPTCHAPTDSSSPSGLTF